MQVNKTALQEAIQGGETYANVHLPYMLRAMDGMNIRSTMMILKQSWVTQLREFDMVNDMPMIVKILEEFPATSRTFKNLYKFSDDAEMLCYDTLIEDNYMEDTALDIRSTALLIFEKLWNTTIAFFYSPSMLFYKQSRNFFHSKIELLKDYNNPITRKDIQKSACFGKEEKLWIEVTHWREMYIEKLDRYINGQPECTRIHNALHTKYYLDGMEKAMTPPNATCESIEKNDENSAWLATKHMTDGELTGEDSCITMERERRNSAWQILRTIDCRWELGIGI
jgi:hypothetical protein